MKKIGFIGCGNMGGALAKAAASSVGGENIYVSDADTFKVRHFAEEYGANAVTTECIADNCDWIFVGVKPQMLKELFKELAPRFKERETHFILVSMAAGVAIADIKKMSGGDYPIIRIMPNMPASVGAGMILYSATAGISENETAEFLDIMKNAGSLDKIDEKRIDAGSAVSGCGSAYAFMFIEALADGAVACGLPRDKAIAYAAETLKGSAEMVLKSKRHPGALKDAVCSPAGSTIEGVKALEDGSFRADCMNAVIKAYEKTLELGK